MIYKVIWFKIFDLIFCLYFSFLADYLFICLLSYLSTHLPNYFCIFYIYLNLSICMFMEKILLSLSSYLYLPVCLSVRGFLSIQIISSSNYSAYFSTSFYVSVRIHIYLIVYMFSCEINLDNCLSWADWSVCLLTSYYSNHFFCLSSLSFPRLYLCICSFLSMCSFMYLSVCLFLSACSSNYQSN